MTSDYKELCDRLAKGLNFKDNAIVMVTSEPSDENGHYTYCPFMKGSNRQCREAILMLIDGIIRSEDGNKDGQLALIKMFWSFLNQYYDRITGETKEEAEQALKASGKE